MKKSLTSLELHYVIKELDFLIDSKVDKIFHPEKDQLMIQFYVPSKGKFLLNILPGKYLYLTDKKPESAEPTGFCMKLRKTLTNARLRQITQKHPERIIEFLFEKKEGKHKLVIEFFSTGNIILTNDEDLIISATNYDSWKGRTIRPRVIYTYPKKEVNFFDLKKDELKEILNKSIKGSVVTSLATELGLGGTYAEEVCKISDIKKSTKPIEVKDKDLDNLINNIQEVLSKNPKPIQFSEDNQVVDITPFNLKIYQDFEKTPFKSFNQALNDYFSNAQPRKQTQKEKEIQKIKRIIAQQQEKIEELGIKEIEEKNKAELIYQHYQEIKEILEEINKAKEKYSWEDIKKKLKGHKTIKEVNAKDKKVLLEFI
jgi:predicted ribosome quality control (RQC) complex YloA/Tae2 family protein